MDRLGGINFISVILYILCSCQTSAEKALVEPICTSRFDYEHKMIEEMVMLKIEQKNIKESLKELNELFKEYKDKSVKMWNTDEQFERRLQKLEAVTPLDNHGATFIRWGRTSCPENGTELVYKGYAGGSFYNNRGAASSYLCLPDEPVWGAYEDTEQTSGTVWGAEYEFRSRNMYNFFGKNVLDNDVPCCVCRTRRASVLMLPGRNICFDGWTLEYAGYLSSGHDTHYASDFVCVDSDPEILAGGASDVDGKLFYFVEARCGALKCPPYVNGRELTCAVCSK